MALKVLLKRCWVFFLGFLISSVLQFIFFSPISPDILELPLASSVSAPSTNNQSRKVTKLGEGLLKGPLDVAVDENGTLYTASRDGWIRRLHRNGSCTAKLCLESQQQKEVFLFSVIERSMNSPVLLWACLSLQKTM